MPQLHALVTQLGYDVRDYGATGGSDDTTAFQAAINAANTAGGGLVYVPSGIYTCAQLTMYSNVKLIGAGAGATTIKLKDGTNADLIRTQNFASLTGTNTGAAPNNYSIENMTLAGNSANNSAGNGISAYGYRPVYKWVEITDFAGVGIYQEWRATAGYASVNLTGHDMHGRIVGCDIHDNLGGGVDWYGPSDANMVSTDIYRNGPTSSSTTIGLRVRGNATSFRASLSHVWGTQHNTAVSAEASGLQLHQTDLEGALTAQLLCLANSGVVKGGKIFTPGTNLVGIQMGQHDGSGSAIGGWDIDTFMSGCNVHLGHDGGGHTVRLNVFQSDTTVATIAGTMSTGTRSTWQLFTSGGGKDYGTGVFNTISDQFAFVRQIRRLIDPTMPAEALSQTGSRADQSDNLAAFTSGDLNVVLLAVQANRTYTGLCFVSGLTAAVTVSNIWYALYQADETLAGQVTANQIQLAITADDVATGWPASTAKKLAFATPYTPTADSRVYAGVCVVAATMPTMIGTLTLGPVTAIIPKVTGIRGTFTNPASAPATLGVLSGGTRAPYAYLY
jgi:hypothetical protein